MSFLRTAMSRAAYTSPPANEEEEVPTEVGTTLDDLERRIRAIEQQVVSLQCEIQRTGKAYMTAREALMQAQAEFCERLKDSGVRAEPVRVPPAIEML